MFDNGVKKTMERLRLDACIEPSDDSYPYAAERKEEKLDVAASSLRPDGLVQTGRGRQGRTMYPTSLMYRASWALSRGGQHKIRRGTISVPNGALGVPFFLALFFHFLGRRGTARNPKPDQTTTTT